MEGKNYFDTDYLIHIAQQYYYENKTQSEIAKENGISRPQVSKLLSHARQDGIVTITVQSPANSLRDLQNVMIQRFGLTDCLVVPSVPDSFDGMQLIAKKAAEYIDRITSRASLVGLGWGELLNTITLSEDLIPQPHKSEGVVMPLIGSITASNNGYNTNELVRMFASKFAFVPYDLYSPAFPSSISEYNQFCQTENYREISQKWDQMDVAIFRVFNYPSAPDHATKSRFGDELIRRHAVGALLSYFYDVAGHFIEGENDYCISASIDQIKRAPISLGICSTSTTPLSLLGALRSGLLTHLIADESLLKQALTIAFPNSK